MTKEQYKERKRDFARLCPQPHLRLHLAIFLRIAVNKMERTMANEEKAREIANNCSTEIVGAEVSDETYITTEPDCYTAAMTMAQWKDEQLAKEKQALIDKACEWLKANVSKHIHGDYTFLKGIMLEEFQQAMKGGEK